MKVGHLIVASVTPLFLLAGLGTENVVRVGGHDTRVARAAGDGLDDVAVTSVRVGPDLALAGCASWDIKDNCCPAGCAAQNGTNWPKADKILRGCMRGLGCPESDVKGATVFMKCDCPK